MLRLLLLVACLALCLPPPPVIAAAAFSNLCLNSQDRATNNKACLPSTPLSERSQLLLSKLSLKERMESMRFSAPPLPSLNESQSYQWWGEALHGLGYSPSVRFSPSHFATSFPAPISLAASLNTSLWLAVAQAISTEARAFFNDARSGLTFWAPNINVFRDPRWGRGAETPGEDPTLNGEYAVLFVRGMQELPTPHAWALKSSACCKHFAAYSIENWHGNSRHAFNAQVSERDLEETYLPAFRACVTRGKASCVMCSYNKINGIPACMSPLLKRLRGEWGFDGYITSDCQALGDAASSVGNASKAKDAILDAGVDLDCGAFFETHLTEADPVSAPAERLLRTQLRLGLFDRIRSEFQAVDGYRIATHASTRKHLDLALDAALQSFVLLKNRDAALPLPSASTFKRVALIGPLLDASASEMLGPCVGRW